jgi:iron complex outermembrane recepter protein
MTHSNSVSDSHRAASPRPGAARWSHRGALAATAALLLLGTLTCNADESQASGSTLQEITVTATRRAENINKVPINVTAYGQSQMDVQGMKDFNDIARLTPDLLFTQTTGAAGNNSTNIAIRGVYSDVGAPTTGIYIDDTPIQMQNIGYWNANAFPQIFDLERVEVLRGPQGTLFGAGAEGGAVRFILPEPGLTQYSAYVRSDVADTVDGSPSYELGAAGGGPIIDNTLGFRASLWGRNDGGYIDRVSPDTGQTVDSHSNSRQSVEGRLALAAQLAEGLKLTGSVLYQSVDDHDRGQYWSTLSDASADDFKQGSRVRQPTSDKFYLPALKVQYDTDSVAFTSNTSYFDHRDDATLDYTTYFDGIFDGNPLQFLPGDAPSLAYITNRQHAFTEEDRLQSADDHARLTWTVGVFYSDTRQNDQDVTINGQAVYTSVLGSTPSFVEYTSAVDKQIAGYANADFDVTSALKLLAGVRISHDRFSFDQTGAFSGVANAPVSGTQTSTPVTPKYGLSYQIDASNYLYLTAAKGFRQGGVNGNVPVNLCGSDLAALGLTTTPTSYSPDSLWSYEIGTKDGFFGGRLALDPSVYTIKWKNIQESVRMPSCGFSYVGNLGEATGYGGDMDARMEITRHLLAGVNAGYVSLTYDRPIYEGASAVLVNKGDVIGGPPFHMAAWAVYNFRAFGKDGFYRVDYSYQNGWPAVDSGTFGYDPTLPVPGATHLLSMRLGMDVGAWELSVYGNNVTNEESPLAISHDIPGSLPYYLSSYRPPTVGVTAVLRY